MSTHEAGEFGTFTLRGEKPKTGCPRGEHVHRDGTRWPSGHSCGGDR